MTWVLTHWPIAESALNLGSQYSCKNLVICWIKLHPSTFPCTHVRWPQDTTKTNETCDPRGRLHNGTMFYAHRRLTTLKTELQGFYTKSECHTLCHEDQWFHIFSWLFLELKHRDSADTCMCMCTISMVTSCVIGKCWPTVLHVLHRNEIDVNLTDIKGYTIPFLQSQWIALGSTYWAEVVGSFMNKWIDICGRIHLIAFNDY